MQVLLEAETSSVLFAEWGFSEQLCRKRSFLAHFPLPSQSTGFSQQNLCQNSCHNQNAKT
jgi:hypothetical protein